MSDYLTPPHNTDAEQAVLGGIMLDGGEERSQKVLAMLKPESFYNKAHGAIFEAVRDLLKRNQPVDLLTVSDELGRRGVLEQTGGFAYLAEISKGVPSVANIVHYAAAVRDCAMERYAISKLAEATEMLYTRSTMNAVEKLEAVSTLTSQISDYAKTGNRRGARALIDVMDDWLREVEGRFDNSDAHRGLSTGIPSLDAMLEPKGLVKGSLFVIGARPKMGKAMPLESKILLSDGTWTTHGAISVGDSIASVDGRESIVTGVFPQGVRKMYRVTFEDGREVKAADSHLWEVSSSKFTGARVIDTETIESMLQRVRYQGRLCIPAVSGDFGGGNSEIDGWVLGALLGDGSLTKCVKFTNSEDYVLTRMAGSVSPLNFVCVGENDYLISNRKGCKNPLLERLRDYGLMGKTACQKEIPESIFTADKNTRTGVLVGLLETDGWVEKFGCIRFSSSSKALAAGVIRLVHSLGGTARETTRTEISYSYKGEIRDGMDAHMVSLKLPDAILDRIESPRLRKNLGVNRLGNRGVGIKSVVEIEPQECLCIMVSHSRNLYVTDEYIVTHNTTLYSQMAINTAMREKLPAVLFSLEMPDKQIFERMVGQASGVNTDIFYRGSDNDTDFALANGHAMELVQSGNLFIDDTPGITLAHIVAESRRIKREKGAVGMVMVDYLTLMTGEKADRNDLSFGLITKGLKNLAKELDCVVVLLTQLNRDLEKRTNKRPLPSDSRDTGQIEQDCDYWLGIYREGAYDENYPQHETELLLRLNRHGKTGVVYAEQKNGAIYDADQLAYQAKAAEREAKPQKRGGF